MKVNKKERSKPSIAHGALAIIAAILWLFYSFSGDRRPAVMIVSGVIVLLLLVPLVRRL